jgi:DNA-binding NarL/FixJ family response regulator
MKDNNPPLRILVIEDEVIIARTIEHLLNKHFNCTIYIALSVEAAIQEMPYFLPQLVLCDINLNDTQTGIELIERIQKGYYFETIFITAYSTKTIFEQASLVMPTNYIIKPFDENQLIVAVKLVENKLISSPDAGTLRFDLRSILSKMEYRILQLVCENMTSPEISLSLHISPHTVRNHRHNISKKLNLPAENNSLIKWAIEHKHLIE